MGTKTHWHKQPVFLQVLVSKVWVAKLPVTHRATSSVLRAIVLPKLMLEKNHNGLCTLVHGHLLLEMLGEDFGVPTCQHFFCKRLQPDPEDEGPLFVSALQNYSVPLKFQVTMLLVVWFGVAVI